MPGALDLLSKERVRDLDVDQPAAAGGRLQSCVIAEAAKSMPGALDLLSKERVRDLDVDQPAAAGGRLQSYERLPNGRP